VFRRDAELDAEYLILAEHLDGSGSRLEIQRGLHEDDQDRARGMEGHCLVDELHATHYGAVAAWRIDGACLDIDLTDEASETFGASGFRIALPAAQRSTVERALLQLVA
jgi:hypothetical protein